MFSGKAQGLLFETLFAAFSNVSNARRKTFGAGAQILHGRLRSIDRCTIMAVQQIRLQRMVDYLEGHSEYYRQLFRRTGIRSDDIRSADDLSGLPLTSLVTTCGIGRVISGASRRILSLQAFSVPVPQESPSGSTTVSRMSRLPQTTGLPWCCQSMETRRWSPPSPCRCAMDFGSAGDNPPGSSRKLADSR